MIREASVAKKGNDCFYAKCPQRPQRASLTFDTTPLRYFRKALKALRRVLAGSQPPKGSARNPCAEDLREHNDLLMHGTLDVVGQHTSACMNFRGRSC